MKSIVETVAQSIENEVTFPVETEFVKHDPLWRAFDRWRVYVYGTTEVPEGYANSGGHYDAFTITVEYVEPAVEQMQNLERNEEAELDIYDVGASLKTWANAHKMFPAAGDVQEIEEFNWTGTTYPAATARELGVRFLVATFVAKRTSTYG